MILLCFVFGAKTALSQVRLMRSQLMRGTADADGLYKLRLYKRSDLIKRVSPAQTDQPGAAAEYPDLYTESDWDAVVPVSALLQIKTSLAVNADGSVDYKIIAPQTKYQNTIARLLGQVKLNGSPDTEYYILPKEEENFLVLYKVGLPDTIPYDELPVAKAIGNLLAVPLVRYPMEHCVAVIIKDQHNQDTGPGGTRQYRPLCDGVKKGDYDYIRLRETNRKVFQYMEKTGLLSRDFFSGLWLYQRTVLESPESDPIEESPSHLVEFRPAIDGLKVVKVSATEEDKMQVIFIPVQWVDYRIRNRKDSEILSEEMVTAGSSEEPLRYLKISFEKLTESDLNSDYETKLKTACITENHFSFDIEITKKDKEDSDVKKDTDTYLIKYAFQRRQTADGTVGKRGCLVSSK